MNRSACRRLITLSCRNSTQSRSSALSAGIVDTSAVSRPRRSPQPAAVHCEGACEQRSCAGSGPRDRPCPCQGRVRFRTQPGPRRAEPAPTTRDGRGLRRAEPAPTARAWDEANHRRQPATALARDGPNPRRRPGNTTSRTRADGREIRRAEPAPTTRDGRGPRPEPAPTAGARDGLHPRLRPEPAQLPLKIHRDGRLRLLQRRGSSIAVDHRTLQHGTRRGNVTDW